MHLLTGELIEDYVRRPRGQYLDIKHFEPLGIGHTFYYFRLGDEDAVVQAADGQIVASAEGADSLELPEGGYATVKSLEEFWLSERVMGTFGQSSSLALKGLLLVHGPTIDPLFEGRLHLGLKNLLGRPTTIAFGTHIGKVCFYDISDTYPVGDPTLTRPGSAIARKFSERRPDPSA